MKRTSKLICLSIATIGVLTTSGYLSSCSITKAKIDSGGDKEIDYGNDIRCSFSFVEFYVDEAQILINGLSGHEQYYENNFSTQVVNDGIQVLIKATSMPTEHVLGFVVDVTCKMKSINYQSDFRVHVRDYDTTPNPLVKINMLINSVSTPDQYIEDSQIINDSEDDAFNVIKTKSITDIRYVNPDFNNNATRNYVNNMLCADFVYFTQKIKENIKNISPIALGVEDGWTCDLDFTYNCKSAIIIGFQFNFIGVANTIFGKVSMNFNVHTNGDWMLIGAFNGPQSISTVKNINFLEITNAPPSGLSSSYTYSLQTNSILIKSYTKTYMKNEKSFLGMQFKDVDSGIHVASYCLSRVNTINKVLINQNSANGNGKWIIDCKNQTYEQMVSDKFWNCTQFLSYEDNKYFRYGLVNNQYQYFTTSGGDQIDYYKILTWNNDPSDDSHGTYFNKNDDGSFSFVIKYNYCITDGNPDDNAFYFSSPDSLILENLAQ